MPRIRYVNHDGTETEAEVPVGWSLMQGAVQNNIEGIVAECGGACMCATCHVRLDDAALATLAAADETELEMLEFTAAERTGNSRLGCQIPVTADMDGLVVRIAEIQ